MPIRIAGQEVTCENFEVAEFIQPRVAFPAVEDKTAVVDLNPYLWSHRSEPRLRVLLRITVVARDTDEEEESEGDSADEESDDVFIGSLTCASEFEFENLADLWENEDGTGLPNDVSAMLLSVLYSGARGVIAGRASGSVWASLPLPLAKMQEIAEEVDLTESYGAEASERANRR